MSAFAKNCQIKAVFISNWLVTPIFTIQYEKVSEIKVIIVCKAKSMKKCPRD